MGSDIIEYSFDELATDDDITKGNIAITKMRFLHLTETSGVPSEDCFDCTEPRRSTISSVTECLPVNDCITISPFYRNAIYTKDGWLINTGQNGYKHFSANQWLRVISFLNCSFEPLP